MNINRRRNDKPKIMRWLGNMSILDDFLDSKNWFSFWVPFKIVSSYFRSLGVVAFASNPLTGILIFVAMILRNPYVALGSLVTGVISILTCKMMQVSDRDVCSGAAIFNSILVGCVVTSVLPTLIKIQLGVTFWIFLAIIGFVTNFIDQGLQSLMLPSKLPVQSVPFNLVASVAILVIKTKYLGIDFALQEKYQISSNISETPDWALVIEGSIRGIGQIYGVGDLSSSIIIWLGFILYSPFLSVLFYIGSLIGSSVAFLMSIQPLEDIYSGLWSFNSLLTAGGVGFFVSPTPFNLLLAVISSTVAVSVQAAITIIFMQTSLPVFSFPFNVTIMIILAITLQGKRSTYFLNSRSFPEEHFLRHYELCGYEGYAIEEEETVTPLRILEKI